MPSARKPAVFVATEDISPGGDGRRQWNRGNDQRFFDDRFDDLGFVYFSNRRRGWWQIGGKTGQDAEPDHHCGTPGGKKHGAHSVPPHI
jgi:hypothetical protein